jgi:hypothetical protein
MPPRGLSRTERVYVQASKDNSEDGVQGTRLRLDLESYHATENGRGLNHVSDVEKSCLSSNMMMTGNNSWLCFVHPWNERRHTLSYVTVNERHRVSGKRNHFCAILSVKVIQTCPSELNKMIREKCLFFSTCSTYGLRVSCQRPFRRKIGAWRVTVRRPSLAGRIVWIAFLPQRACDDRGQGC